MSQVGLRTGKHFLNSFSLRELTFNLDFFKDVDIESLVDELQRKLKQIKTDVTEQVLDCVTPEESTSPASDTSVHEVAKLYYAAFPSLGLQRSEAKSIILQELNAKADAGLRKDIREGRIRIGRQSWDGQRIIEVSKHNTSSSSEKDFDEKDFHAESCITTSDFNGVKPPVDASIDNVFRRESVLDNFVSESGKGFGVAEIVLPDWEDEKYRNLASKFTSDIASIWKKEMDDSSSSFSSTGIWSADSSFVATRTTSSPNTKKLWLMNGLRAENVLADCKDYLEASIDTLSWSADKLVDFTGPSWLNMPSPNRNKTSLSNHGLNSLFVEVPPKLEKDLTDSSEEIALHNFTELKNLDMPLNTSQTHFQPIRQDYYEREASIVIDPDVCGMVPCSPKCPNRGKRNCSPRKDIERSASPSQVELSKYIGPFLDGEIVLENGDLELTEDNLPIGECFEKLSQCSDKATNTEEGTLEHTSRASSSVSESPEPEISEYDTLCSLLNEVLHKEIDSEESMNEEQRWPWRKFTSECSLPPPSLKAVLASQDLKLEQLDSRILAMQAEIREEEEQIFADIIKQTEQNQGALEARKEFLSTVAYPGDESEINEWSDYTRNEFSGSTKTGDMANWSTGDYEFSYEVQREGEDAPSAYFALDQDEEEWLKSEQISSMMGDFKQKNGNYTLPYFNDF